MLASIVLGRPFPSRAEPTMIRPKLSTSSSSTSPPAKKQHKRACSSPIPNLTDETVFRARPCYSPVRPNSLVLDPILPPPPPPPPPSSSTSSISQSDSQLNNRRRPCPLRMSSTPEEVEGLSDDDESTTTKKMMSSTNCHLSKSAQQLHFSTLLDMESEEQQQHQTKVLPPEIDRKKFFVSLQTLERDFLP